MAQYLILDSFPSEKLRLDEAENQYQVILAGGCSAAARQPASARTSECASTETVSSTPSSLVNEIAKARQQIKQSLDGGEVSVDNNVLSRLESLAAENQELKKVTSDLAALVKKLEARVSALEGGAAATTPQSVEKPVSKQQEEEEEEEEDEDEDDFELFGDEEDEDEEARQKLKDERIAAYMAKKSTKPALIAKSSVLLDVKPWDDETDMEALEAQVRTIVMDGLLWGASKFVAVGYGIRKLQIMCVVVDDKVSIDDLSEQICEFEDFVQSVDIAAFSKI